MTTFINEQRARWGVEPICRTLQVAHPATTPRRAGRRRLDWSATGNWPRPSASYVERFTDFDQLLAFARVHLAERSSGRKGSNPETAWHMSKAGNSNLRAAAYRMAVVGVQHNPVIAAQYARKWAAGKSKMNALGHCMRKALSLAWGVWRNGVDFDPSWEGPDLTRPMGLG